MTFRSGYVAFLGLPNVGKSTLMNAIVGESVAIVCALPQTTRQRITGIYSTDACQMILLDTPGLHESPKAINQQMVRWAKQAMNDADCCCAVVAADDTRTCEVLEHIPAHQLSCVVVNKIDLVNAQTLESVVKRIAKRCDADIVPLSAIHGPEVIQFREDLLQRLPEGPPYFPTDIYTEHPIRFLVAELIRKAALERLMQELPYAIAVEIDDFTDGGTLTRIEATIVVERDSQKGMVVGQGGTMIKSIGIAARHAIEPLVGTQVFLKLRVAVEHKWTQNPAQLSRFGLVPPKG